jgi:hypothetical protein
VGHVRALSQAPTNGATVPLVARIPLRAPHASAWMAGFLIPLKAARVDVAGLSLYASYVVAALVFVRYRHDCLRSLQRWFVLPFIVVSGFAGWALVRGAGALDPAITLGKMMFAFATTATFVALLRRSERSLFNGLLAGVGLSVGYMIYQWISSVFFGFGLPFTTSERLQIGLGLSQRYGLARVTGFTEEPSFIATMMAGSVLLLLTYAHRRQRPRLFRVTAAIGVIGLALCTSNNLFATALIIAAGWAFIRKRRVTTVLVVYYIAAMIVTPLVLYRDITYYARFSPYDIFLRSGPLDQFIGRGLGSYPAYFAVEQVRFDGIEVRSLASVWGGFLFEGGVVLVILVIGWLARLIRSTGWPEGLTLLTVLLMLSNYNSPWWPLVSLAVAQCLFRQRKDSEWTTTSISVATQPVFGVTRAPLPRSRS